MTRSVLVIGGGLAGLTAALHLCQRGYAVTLVDEGERFGGRLLGSAPVLLGYHRATRALLRALRPSVGGEPFGRGRLVFDLNSRQIPLPRPWLPGPLHGLLALVLFPGLPPADRWHALNLVERTWEGSPASLADLEPHTADAWLKDSGQSEQARTQVWNPLCRFYLGDDLSVISAAQFARVMTRSLLSARRDAGVAITRSPVSDALVTAILDRLRRGGATTRVGQRVSQILCKGDLVTSVILEGGEALTANCYVAAIPHHNLLALLPDRLLTRFTYFEQLTRLRDSPAIIAHLQMARVEARRRVSLLVGRTFHWLVNHGATAPQDARGTITVVATGCDSLLAQSDEQLVQSALADVAKAIPAMRDVPCRHSAIVRDRHACLSLRPGTAMLRPLAQSPVRNLVLAGAWTDTQLPTSLESAVVSGIRCAEAIATQAVPT